MKEIFGYLTLVLAVLFVVIALPTQILKNYFEKKYGLSLAMTILPLGVYLSRAAYAVTIQSWFILVPDLFGVFFMGVLCYQYYAYK